MERRWLNWLKCRKTSDFDIRQFQHDLNIEAKQLQVRGIFVDLGDLIFISIEGTQTNTNLACSIICDDFELEVKNVTMLFLNVCTCENSPCVCPIVLPPSRCFSMYSIFLSDHPEMEMRNHHRYVYLYEPEEAKKQRQEYGKLMMTWINAQ